MPVFMVRLKDEQELVGFFSIDSEFGGEDLFWTVDEVTNPYACEACELPNPGGVLFLGRASKVPVHWVEEEVDDPKQAELAAQSNHENIKQLFVGATLSETWSNQVINFDHDSKLKWLDVGKMKQG
ncbi:hypothetical protein [Pseudaestuariivita sp.]|uniref:hypothetical protein n=1 Tax=Pseudaestuariivita sp. TaxID=2211669 RepID=UPI00405861B2